MEADVLRKELAALKAVLCESEERDLALSVQEALEGSEDELRAFLVSNELWGGAGSIADQAGIDHDRKTRRRIESALASLEKAQIGQGVVNARTTMWVDAFAVWKSEDI